MVRRNDPTIDEEALRQAIGRQSSHGSVLRTPEDPTTDDEPAPPPEAVASEACEPRRRRLRMPDYERTFLCVSDVQRRAGIYASEETKRKLLDVVQLLGRGNLSLTATWTTSCAITSNFTARRSTACTNNEIPKTFSKSIILCMQPII